MPFVSLLVVIAGWLLRFAIGVVTLGGFRPSLVDEMEGLTISLTFKSIAETDDLIGGEGAGRLGMILDLVMSGCC